MRTIAALLIAALVLTLTLAHAHASGAGGAALVLPLFLILVLVDIERKSPRAAQAPPPLPSLPSESPSSTVPAGGRYAARLPSVWWSASLGYGRGASRARLVLLGGRGSNRDVSQCVGGPLWYIDSGRS